MNARLQQLIARVDALVSPPAICLKLEKAIEDPRTSAYDMACLVEQDPALAARLLRIVNSSFYGFPSSVDSISRAVTIIGTRDLRDLVLATALVETLSSLNSQSPGATIAVERFWSHSVFCGIAARVLGEQCHDGHADRLFTAGLLHDMGMLALLNQAPDDFSLCLRLAEESGDDLCQVERAVLGFDHAQTGAALAKQWNLPAALVQIIEEHHELREGDLRGRGSAAVHVADFIANSIEEYCGHRRDGTVLDSAAWNALGLQLDALDQVFVVTEQRFEEWFDLLLPSNLAA